MTQKGFGVINREFFIIAVACCRIKRSSIDLMVFCEIKVFTAIMLTIGMKVTGTSCCDLKAFRNVIDYLAFVFALPYCEKEVKRCY